MTPVLAASGVSFLVAGLVAIAFGALVAAFAFSGERRRMGVDEQLRGYGAGADGSDAPASGGEFADTAIVQRAVAFTGALAERAGILGRTERMLEQAALPMRAAEALFGYGILLFAAGAVGLVGGGPVVAVILVAFAAVVPPVVVGRRRDKRVERFQAQLPQVLDLLAGSMRAGYSFLQAMEVVTTESVEPMRREMERVFTESRLGRSLEDALDDCAARMQSPDLGWVVLAVRIQREVGGNLAEIFETVAETMTERDQFRAEVKALTAEGRLSGVIVALIPIVVGCILGLMNPKYMGRLFTSAAGIVAVVSAGLLVLVGFLWIRKIVAVKV